MIMLNNSLWEKVVAGGRVFIIAEAGVNHNGRLDLAFDLVDAAVGTGVDAVKFQTSKVELGMSRFAQKAKYQLETTNANESQIEMIRRLELSYDATKKLSDYCEKRGITFISTPFEEESADFLYALGVPFYKIGSGELTNLPFLEYVAKKGKPIVLSTGMSFLSEVEDAVNTISNAGCKELALLHCISNYPAEDKDVNLMAMITLKQVFNLPVGYSDHTVGYEISLAAVVLGAGIIEKHFTLDKNLPGPDHLASLEPDELKRMVESIRRVEKSLGDGVKRPATSEFNVKCVARKSLVAACDIQPRTIITKSHIVIKRPGTGLAPGDFKTLLGKKARVFIPEDTVLDLDMFE